MSQRPHHTRRTPAARAAQGLAALIALATMVGGVPWALSRYVGWPLPDHLPSWAEIQNTLTAPMSTSLLLNVLAVLCWLAWAAFLVDIARALPGAIRAATNDLPRPTVTLRSGPIHALATVLVTTVVIALVGNRPPAASVDHPTPAATTTLTTHSVEDTAMEVASAGTAPHEPAANTVVVREPRGGIYDCLWRIADRELGDGARWPEIYRLNHGLPQADGRALTNPNLIYPGWVLRLPAPPPDQDAGDAPVTPDDQRTPAPTPTPHATAEPTIPTATPSASPPSPPPADAATPDTTGPAGSTPDTTGTTDQPARPPAIDLGPGVFVGLGLAAAISAALLVLLRRRRRWYRPGSGHRSDLPVAPIVRTIRLAHLRHTDLAEPIPHDRDPASDDQSDDAGEPDTAASLDTAPPPPAGLPVGVREGHAIAIDLARSHGLGLIGPGALGAARALLLGLLTARKTPPTQVLIPESDLALLLDTPNTRNQVTTLRVVTDLHSALDELERDIAHRARLTHEAANLSSPPVPPLILIANPHPAANRRLQAVVDNGSTLSVAGILLDQWRPGATAHIRADGTVTATNPGPAEHLRTARLFTLPAPEATDLLALLRQAANHGNNPDPAPQPSTTNDSDSDNAAGKPSPRASPPERRDDPAPATTSPDENTPAVLTVTILGPPRLTWHPAGPPAHDLTTTLTTRQHELIVALALHPDGLGRETLADTLWPDGPAERPLNALHTTLSRLRRTLREKVDASLATVITTSSDRYRLNPDLVDVDYWHLTRAVAASRAATTDTARTAADRQIIDCYRGELATGMHANWLDTPRETARRDAIDAAARLARQLADTDPQQALHLLETARGFDPYNELIYRDIMRLQARIGQPDAISRTLALLTTRLAELDEHPDPATITLATELQHRTGTAPNPRARHTRTRP